MICTALVFCALLRSLIFLDHLQAVAGFMSKAVGNSISYNPSQIVLTAGATPAIEILSFCLADSGNAFLVPAPYYPG